MGKTPKQFITAVVMDNSLRHHRAETGHAFAQPQWHSLLALAAGWAVAMPLLAWLARRGLQSHSPGGTA